MKVYQQFYHTRSSTKTADTGTNSREAAQGQGRGPSLCRVQFLGLSQCSLRRADGPLLRAGPCFLVFTPPTGLQEATELEESCRVPNPIASAPGRDWWFPTGPWALGSLLVRGSLTSAPRFLFFSLQEGHPWLSEKQVWNGNLPFSFLPGSDGSSSSTGIRGPESPEQTHSAGQCLEQICIAGFSSPLRILLGVSLGMVGLSPLSCLNFYRFPKQCACSENPSW